MRRILFSAVLAAAIFFGSLGLFARGGGPWCPEEQTGGQAPSGLSPQEWEEMLAQIPPSDRAEGAGSPETVAQTAKLYNTGGVIGGESLGFSVAVSPEGEWAVLGAPYATRDGYANNGYACLFHRDPGGSTWTLLWYLLPSPSGGANWYFGYSVALSGDFIAIGAPGADGASGRVYLFYRNASGADHWGPLTSVGGTSIPDGNAWDQLGTSVSLDGDVLVAGVPYDDYATNVDQGSAAVFERNSGGADNWGFVKRIWCPFGSANDHFGASVAVDHNWVLVGAPYLDTYGVENMGAAYLFNRNQSDGAGGGYGYVASLIPPDGAAWDGFAYSVAIGNDTILIGSPAHDAAGPDQGAAYLFKRNQGGADTWGFFKKLLAADGTGWGHFGYSVALIDGMALVGGDWANAAYLFSQNQGGADNWGQIKKITASDAADNDFFGSAVALQPGVALVGAYGDDISVADQGSAYLFRWDDGLNARNTLTPFDGADNQQYGRSVAISGDTAAIGSDITDGSTYCGAVYLYRRNQGGSHQWNLLKKITAIEWQAPPFNNAFGFAVALDGDVLVVGDPYKDGGTGLPFQGAAYVFYRNQGGADNWGFVKKILGAAQAEANFGWSLALDGGELAVGAEGYDRTANGDEGAVYIFYRNAGGADNWGGVYGLAPSAVYMGQYGYSVAIHGDTLVVGAPNQWAYWTTDPGRIFIHGRNVGGADTWGVEQQWVGPNEMAHFGTSVAVFDDIVAEGCTGCPYPPGSTNWLGTVSVFRRNAGGASNWGRVAEVTDPAGTNGAEVGRSLAMEGDQIVAGAHTSSYFLRTLVFSRNQGGADAWGLKTTLPVSVGDALAISGRTILSSDSGFNNSQGMARLFYNHAPLAVDDAYSTPAGVPLAVAAPGVLTNDNDQNGDEITPYKDAGPAHGSVTLNANGAFSYTPAGGFSGPDSFTYHLSDGVTNSDPATVSVNVVMGTPSNFAVADLSPCAFGLSVTFTPAAGATRHDLYVDGSSAVPGISSGYVYNPGESSSHSYKVRAVNGYGSWTESPEIGKSDVNDGPGVPTITGITDLDPCAASGIQIAYTGGSGAASHNLLKDSVVVVTGYSPGATYVPGDTAAHAYIVQAVKGSCTANSASSSGTDLSNMPGAPVITAITDESPCAQSGIRVMYSGGPGAARHDLARDGAVVVTGYAYGALYDPGDTNSHIYAIRAVSGSCTADSAGFAAADFNDQPATPVITGIADDDPNAQTGIRVNYTPAWNASSHALLRNGAVVVTDYASGALYNPGTTASATYSIRAIDGTCAADSSTSSFGDAASTVDLSLSITADPAPVCVGSSLGLSFAASNAGPGTAGAARVTGTLPSSLNLGLAAVGDDDASDFGAGTHSGTTWDSGAGKLTIQPTWPSQWELPDNQGNTWIDMTGNVALYHMNETSGVFADSSGQGNSATPHNGVIQGVAGQISGGAWFDGTDDYADAPDAPGLNPTTELTVAFWIKPGTASQDRKIVGKVLGGGSMRGYVVGAWSGVYPEIWDSTGAHYTFGAGTLAAQRWQHVAVTWKTSGKFRGYIDGVKVWEGDAGPNPIGSNTRPLRLCAIPWNDPPNALWVKTSLDEVAVWTRELSATEIQTIVDRQASHFSATYTSRVFDAGASRTWTTLEWMPRSPYGKELPGGGQAESGYETGNLSMSGNRVLYHFDEAQGALADSSGNANHGSASGGVTFGREGRFRTALDFDGTTGNVSAANPSVPTGNSAYTIAAWIFPRSMGSRGIVGWGDYGSAGQVNALRLSDDGIVNYWWGADLAASTGPLTGKWHLVAAAYDGATRRLFLDGAPVAQDNPGAPNFTNANFAVGVTNLSEFFDGLIDEVAIWNRGLDPTEVAALYARGEANIKFQVRTCDDAACSGESFAGPSGTSEDYYSELDNAATTPPVLAIRRQANNRYFQYKAVLEFDTSATLPQLSSVTARHAATNTLVATQGTCGLASQTLLCDFNSIASAANATATVTGTATTPAALTTTGTVTSGSIDSNGGNNSDTESTSVADCSAAPPVNDSGPGAARFTKNPDGNTLRVTYDATTCTASKAILLYGSMGDWSGYRGAADCDLGNAGSDDAVGATGLNNVWFNIVWVNGTIAGHPGYGFNGTVPVARTWNVGSRCSVSGDNHSHATCP